MSDEKAFELVDRIMRFYRTLRDAQSTELLNVRPDDPDREQLPGDLPRAIIRTISRPVLSPAGDRVIGGRKLDTGASAVIVGGGRLRLRQKDGKSF